MARKPTDKQWQGAIIRIGQAVQDPQFKLWLVEIKQRIHEEQRLLPTLQKGNGLSFLDQVARWRFQEPVKERVPGAFGRVFYHGVYYDLREVCDICRLVWPDDAEYILRWLLAESEDELDDSMRADDCPPAQHWQFFRLAKTGLGVVRPDELTKAKAVTDTGRQRDLSHGLPNLEIAEWYNVEERTVQNAIKNCWEYCSRKGVTADIAQEAGLTPNEYLALLFNLDFLEDSIVDNRGNPLEIPLDYFDTKDEK
jgi:hypothetical protein